MRTSEFRCRFHRSHGIVELTIKSGARRLPLLEAVVDDKLAIDVKFRSPNHRQAEVERSVFFRYDET
jgi:hypothetical protein